jgi:Ca2+-binding RTX toxin-like protein
MSYFSMTDNRSYNYPATYVLSPMAADIVAMQSLYGLSTTTRTGDTTYGFNSNAGGIYDASLHPNASYAIFDNGGTDNLDFSGGTYTQRINLNPDTFTSFRHNLDIYIARGVTIENVISGSGDDTIVQNSANNILNGGPGSDTVSYTTATAGIAVDLRLAGAQNTLGAGVDTLINIEQLIGTAFNDALTGGSATTRLEGGAGNDLLQSGGRITGSIGLYGGDGDDTFILGDASDWADGGDGFDTVDYSGATAGVLASTSGRVGASVDTLLNVERIIGSNFADDLYAWDAGAAVVGGAGDDILRSMWGSATLTGGTGSDTFRGSPDGLNNDVITDFSRGDRILISNVSNFSISLVGEHLIYAGGSLTLSGVRMPSLRVSLSYEGGMQILFDGPPIVLAGGSSVTLATSAKSIELTSEAPSMVAHDFSGRAGIPGADWMPPLDVAHYDAALAVPDLLGLG